VWPDVFRAQALFRMLIMRMIVFSTCLLLAWPLIAQAQTTESTPQAALAPTIEIYGFVEGDAIVDVGQNNPDWYDANRPSKLPAFVNEFGQNGHFYLSPRQTRRRVCRCRSPVTDN